MPPPGSPYYASRTSSQAEHDRKKLSKTCRDELDDKSSIRSRSSQVSQNPQAVEALREIAGDRVRHAKCAPEYLEALSLRGDGKQVKVIAGDEASTFFVKYLGEQDSETASLRSGKTRQNPRAVVFAVTVWDHRRKCIDYYMTWRGKNQRQESKGQERSVEALDDEFRRVARRLDRDFKKISRAGSAASRSSRRSSGRRDHSPTSPRKTRPPEIMVSAPETELSPQAEQPPISEPPVSATSSVISLPYLNMIRGVPRGHRLPLIITNPDRNSMISAFDVALSATSLGTPRELVSVAEEATAPTIAVSPPDTTAPIPEVSTIEPSGLTPLMKSSASIASADTHSSKSSRSSRSSSHRDGSHRSRRHSSRDKEDRTSSRKDENASPRDEPPIEFLIVALGDKLEKEGLSWHGLERQSSTRTQQRAGPRERHSPWTGPLARADTLKYQQGSNAPPGDSDSDESYDEGGWKDSPVIPLKPLLESMGLIPPDQSSYHHAAVIPHPVNYHVASSPGPQSRSLRYSPSPRISPSQYVPAWMPQSSGINSPASRPPSRALSALSATAMSYNSPYLRPRSGL